MPNKKRAESESEFATKGEYIEAALRAEAGTDSDVARWASCSRQRVHQVRQALVAKRLLPNRPRGLRSAARDSRGPSLAEAKAHVRRLERRIKAIRARLKQLGPLKRKATDEGRALRRELEAITARPDSPSRKQG